MLLHRLCHKLIEIKIFSGLSVHIYMYAICLERTYATFVFETTFLITLLTKAWNNLPTYTSFSKEHFHFHRLRLHHHQLHRHHHHRHQNYQLYWDFCILHLPRSYKNQYKVVLLSDMNSALDTLT